MYWGMVERADLEMRLSWQPWIPIFVPPQVQGFDQGNRLVFTDLGDSDKVGLVVGHASLLFTGTPCCKHPLVHTLEVPFVRVSLKLLQWAWVQVKQRLLSEINLRISVYKSTVFAEGKVIGFKPHYCTHGTGFRRMESLWVRRIRRLRFRFRSSLSDALQMFERVRSRS